jgi:hypothetical protein
MKLCQWKAEIEKHAGNSIDKDRVLIFKRGKYNLRQLNDAKVIITSYHEVVKSCPALPNDDQISEMAENGVEPGEYMAHWFANNMDEAGLLHQVKWRRVCTRCF